MFIGKGFMWGVSMDALQLEDTTHVYMYACLSVCFQFQNGDLLMSAPQSL